jgi:hypothetical protein
LCRSDRLRDVLKEVAGLSGSDARAPRRFRCMSLPWYWSTTSSSQEPTLTDQLTTRTPAYTEPFEPFAPFEPGTAVAPAQRTAEAPHWTQHPAHEFPHRTGDHAPNLATLAQLRSGGRNPLLLSVKRRRQVTPKGCTAR